MKMYLKLEGKLGPQPQLQPCTSTPSHDRNSSTRKILVPKKVEKKRRDKAPEKRRFKHEGNHPTYAYQLNFAHEPKQPAEPNPTVATLTATTQMPVAKSAATSISVTVYNLAQEKFEEVPYPTGRPPMEENPSTQLQPEAAVPQNREDTTWLNIMPAFRNMFDVRASWPIPSTETPTVVKMEKTEVPPRVAAIPDALVLNKPQNTRPAEEECRWGPQCPICTKEEGTEDWNGKRQENQQRNHYPQRPQHPPQPMTFLIDFPYRPN